MIRSASSFLRLLAFAAVLCARPAFATDAVTVPLPAPVADHQLTWGSRTLVLPPGEWTAVARGEGHISVRGGSGSERRSTHYTVYAMDTAQGRMRSGVVMRLPADSTPVSGWSSELCKGGDALLRDDFGNDLKRPQCLMVRKMRTHLTSGSDPFFAQARDWAMAQKVDTRGSFYEVYYARMATNDFGIVRVYVPTSAFAGDADAIAWAQQLPPVLQPFFEKRVTQASLPPLPRKGD